MKFPGSLKLILITLALVTISPSFSDAQLDTAGFPLSVGNRWYYKYEYSGSWHTLYVQVKEIIDTTSSGARIVRTRRMDSGDSIWVEQWSVTDGNFFVNADLVYNALLSHDTSWSSGPYSYAYQLGRDTLFGSDTRYQSYQTAYFAGWNTIYTEQRVAVGIALYYTSAHGPGWEIPWWSWTSIIGLKLDGAYYGDTVLTSIDEEPTNRPVALRLFQNYPNPFNPETSIEFDVPHSGHCVLKVYNLLGQETATLLDAEVSAGHHKVVLASGELSTGTYFYRLESSGQNLIRKMFLIK